MEPRRKRRTAPCAVRKRGHWLGLAAALGGLAGLYRLAAGPVLGPGASAMAGPQEPLPDTPLLTAWSQQVLPRLQVAATPELVAPRTSPDINYAMRPLWCLGQLLLQVDVGPEGLTLHHIEWQREPVAGQRPSDLNDVAEIPWHLLGPGLIQNRFLVGQDDVGEFVVRWQARPPLGPAEDTPFVSHAVRVSDGQSRSVPVALVRLDSMPWCLIDYGQGVAGDLAIFAGPIEVFGLYGQSLAQVRLDAQSRTKWVFIDRQVSVARFMGAVVSLPLYVADRHQGRGGDYPPTDLWVLHVPPQVDQPADLSTLIEHGRLEQIAARSSAFDVSTPDHNEPWKASIDRCVRQGSEPDAPLILRRHVVYMQQTGAVIERIQALELWRVPAGNTAGRASGERRSSLLDILAWYDGPHNNSYVYHIGDDRRLHEQPRLPLRSWSLDWQLVPEVGPDGYVYYLRDDGLWCVP